MNDESKVFLDAQTTTLARAATSPRVAAGRFRMRLLCSASGTGKCFLSEPPNTQMLIVGTVGELLSSPLALFGGFARARVEES